MPKLANRFQSLSAGEQRHLVDDAIPNRIALIERCTTEAPTLSRLTTAAIHTRAVAGFLGIGADRNSTWVDDGYHDHGGRRSYEVKVSDIRNGVLFTQRELDALSTADEEAIRVGFDTTNREFAHFTFWSDPTNQQASGAPSEHYIDDLARRIGSFSSTVLRLVRYRLQGL